MDPAGKVLKEGRFFIAQCLEFLKKLNILGNKFSLNWYNKHSDCSFSEAVGKFFPGGQNFNSMSENDKKIDVFGKKLFVLETFVQTFLKRFWQIFVNFLL